MFTLLEKVLLDLLRNYGLTWRLGESHLVTCLVNCGYREEVERKGVEDFMMWRGNERVGWVKEKKWKKYIGNTLNLVQVKSGFYYILNY